MPVKTKFIFSFERLAFLRLAFTRLSFISIHREILRDTASNVASHAHAKVVVKSWFRYSRVLFNFPYSKFFDATSSVVTFYMTARSLVVRAQMMVHGMSSCSSCSAWCRAGRGESVQTCLTSSFPPAGTARMTETCARPHARTCAISASLLCTHDQSRRSVAISATQSAKTTADAATYVS